MTPSASSRPSAGLTPSATAFRRVLMDWYQVSGRHDLPWRKPWSAYRVLVSEFMLQQTTVSTVIPYFQRFMKEMPTLQALAVAPLGRVLELWSGLGYYSRARNLHAAAQRVMQDFKGKIPDRLEALLALSGVGRYTAGAILSFSFNKPEAVVDGNVIRVLCRIYGLRDNVKDPKTVEKIWSLAWKLVPSEGARHFNSALMDFGSLVCRPSAPDCLLCPFSQDCQARQQGRQDQIPYAENKVNRKVVHLYTALIPWKGQWAFVPRPAKGLYGGLWEFPGEESPKKEGDLEKALGPLGKKLKLKMAVQDSLSSFKHILSHREMHVHSLLCDVKKKPKGARKPLLPEGGKWLSLQEIGEMPISSLTRRVLETLQKHLSHQSTATPKKKRPS